ncbi:MAG: hypothetical protein ACI841_000879 [Planctomycetota bacterium]|jgi:hypothetical protein
MALISMLVGVTVPMTNTMLRSKARAELRVLGNVAQEYFRDTNALSRSAAEHDSSAISGWACPYMTGVIDDRRTGMSGYRVDLWSND